MITRRASVTALAAVAVAGLASGCLSSQLGRRQQRWKEPPAGPGKGTVEVMYGFGADTGAALQEGPQHVRARRTGSRSSSPRPGRGTPRSAPGSPVATRRTWASSRSPASCATSPSRRRSSPATTPTSRRDSADMVTGLRRRRHVRRRQGLRPARPRSASRASSGTTSRTSEAAGDQLPTTLDEHAHADRPAQGAGQDTVVHRGRVRQRHRLADHRLDRGPRPAPGRPGRTTTSGSPGR